MRRRRFTILWVALWLMTLALIDGRGSVVQAQSAGPLLTVRETAGIARNGEVVRSGLPIPRSLNVRNPGTLTLVDATNTPVPAEFRVLARWNAGREDSSAPIQWLLVTFPVTIATNGSATYRIVIDGSAGPNPSPAVAVSLSQNGNQVTVNTGVATFTLGGQAEALFDEIRLGSGTRLVSGGALTARVNGANANHPTTRNVGIEHAGPLIAIVVVRGAYDLASVGGGGVGSVRRYVFTAGSPTAIVRQAVSWEGSLCGNGDLTCGGSMNALRVERVRDTLTLDLAAPLSVMAVGHFASLAIQGTSSAGQPAWVRQQLRADRAAPLAFDVSVPGTSGAMGQKADGGMLAASNASGAVAVALNHLHRYEPQAVRLLGNGQLAVDLADDLAWLGARQGLFATMAVSALPANPSRSDLDRAVWAPLNHPLHAWPAPDWFASSGAVDEIPVGPLPADLADYDSHVPAVLSHTLQQVDAKGLAGLMTFGLYPRHWGVVILSDELDCGDNDPTPGETWDNSYWCATWTDYHNTTATATVWAMRSGDVRLLDEIAFPAAWRSLHTQIMQCAPGDDYFYCGQAPAGYGGYRADFNSSHAYFDNLFLYYWLTGDQTVVETFARGASAMRDYLCSRRPAAPCLPHDPPADFYAQLTGRVASQWFAAFRFVGLASDDASYLEDYTSGLGRAVTQHYVEAAQSGTGYGFWLPGDTPVTGPGTYTTDQLWLLSLYDMNVLYRLQRDTNDAPIGDPALPPSQVRAAWARTLTRFGATVSGDGTAGGRWPNQLTFSWSGNRIGGTLTGVSAAPGGGDPFLYDTGKATLTAALVRAGQETNDSSLIQMGADLTRLALTAMRGSEFGPLGKIQGEYLARVPAAVARLAGAISPTTVAAVLPLSRSVQVGGAPATAFAAIVNAGSAMALNCAPAPPSNPPAGLGTFTYQTTTPGNLLTGMPNTPANIAPGAVQNYVFGFAPTAAIAQTSLPMRFVCDNAADAPQTPGVNNFFIVADTSPVPDTIALMATVSGDGVVRIPGSSATQLFAIATSNVGATGTIVVSGDTGGANLPLTLTVCETTGGSVCSAPPTSTVTVSYAAGTNRSFAFFARAAGSIPFDPANNRVFARLTHAGVLRGATSAAVCTTPKAGC